jgi:hypothetical protein
MNRGSNNTDIAFTGPFCETRIFESKGYGAKAQSGKSVHSSEALVWLLKNRFARNLRHSACGHFKAAMRASAPHAG